MDIGYFMVDGKIDESAREYLDEEMEGVDIPEEKIHGVERYLLWRLGSWSGHFKLGRKIIALYDIAEEVKQIKLKYSRRYGNVYHKEYRIKNYQRVLEIERRSYQKNKERIKARNKTEKSKAVRRKRDKIKSELYQKMKGGNNTNDKEN